MQTKIKGNLAALAAICTLIATAIGIFQYMDPREDSEVVAALSQCDHQAAASLLTVERKKFSRPSVKEALFLQSAENYRVLGKYANMQDMIAEIEDSKSDKTQASRLMLLAKHNIEFGDLALAEPKIRKARKLYLDISDNVGVALADLHLAKVFQVSKDVNERKTSHNLAESALQAFRSNEADLETALALRFLALLEANRGKKSDEALIESRLVEALALAAKAKNCYQENSIQLTRSYVNYFTNNDVKEEYIDVIESLKKLELIFEENGLIYSHGQAERFLGLTKKSFDYTAKGWDDYTALVHFYSALADFRWLKNEIAQADTHRNISDILQKTDLAGAFTHLRMAKKIYEKKGDEYGILQTSRKILELKSTSTSPEIIAEFEKLVETFSSGTIRSELVRSLYNVGMKKRQNARTSEELEEARLTLEKAKFDAAGSLNPVLSLDIQLELTRIECTKVSYAVCLDKLNELARDYHLAGAVSGEGNAYRDIATLKFDNDEINDAMVSIDKAIGLHKNDGDVKGLAQDLITKGGFYEDSEQIKLACTTYKTATKHLEDLGDHVNHRGLSGHMSGFCQSSYAELVE